MSYDPHNPMSREAQAHFPEQHTVDLTPDFAKLRRFMREAWFGADPFALRRAVEADPDMMRWLWPDGPQEPTRVTG